MAKLENRVQYALDEGRILVLGAQILLGFEYRSFFEPRYAELPRWIHAGRLVGLFLLVVTFALVTLPTPYHQLVEGGRDSRRMHRIATRALGAALLPLAVALGLDLAAAGGAVRGFSLAAAGALGASGSAIALALWYALPAARRHPRRQQEDAMAQTQTPLERRIQHVLTEARVVLPGAQALLGFQLALTMMEPFAKLPRAAQLLHLADTALTALAVVLLLTPAAYHRIAEDGEETERFQRLAGRLVVAALLPLALGLSGDFAIVGYRVGEAIAPAVALGGAALAVFFAAWFGLPLAARRASVRRRASAPAHA